MYSKINNTIMSKTPCVFELLGNSENNLSYKSKVVPTTPKVELLGNSENILVLKSKPVQCIPQMIVGFIS